MSVCEVRHLCKDYPSFSLRDVSFSLDAGTITGFIGRNGAGKTTTIKSMLNIIHPASGDIAYFEMPLIGNEAAIKQKIGFSTGAVNYYPKKKVRDIAAVTKRFYTSWDDNAYRNYLRLFSLDENKTPCELSEGMKVKVNLLLALSHHAEMLILDEPTAGLDPFSRDELTDIFTRLKGQGVSIFFSTHITSDLEKCADNIVYIRDGRIVLSAAVSQFRAQLGQDGESLEQTILRLEKEARDHASAV